MKDKQPTKRFTSRVENYVRYRPGYPAAILPLLREQTGLLPNWAIADIGSGPGNLARLFLDNGYSVIGVEPNDAMREAGEALLSSNSRFSSVKGSAESTTLLENSIDLVTAGQAFHWFDPSATRIEFQRILRNSGWVALIWNKRSEGSAPILDAWSEMLSKHSPEYNHVRHRDEAAHEGMTVLFGDAGYRTFTFPHEQALDSEAFWGRLISSSYTPLPGEPGHEEIRARSQEIFDEHEVDGVVRFPYETRVHIGQIRAK